jgi:hypothetical protein
MLLNLFEIDFYALAERIDFKYFFGAKIHIGGQEDNPIFFSLPCRAAEQQFNRQQIRITFVPVEVQ